MSSQHQRSLTLSMRNIELLLRAAEFLDKPDFEPCDHVYASSKVVYGGSAAAAGRHQRKQRTKTSGAWSRSHHVGGRSLHNEMEKNRRANLRHCLERLRNAIPEGRGEASKNTTLQLLKRAKMCIMTLEQEHDKFERLKVDLQRQHNQLSQMLSTYRPGAFFGGDKVDGDDGRRRLRSASGSSSSDSGTPSFQTDYLAYRLRSDSDSTSPSPTSISSPASASDASDDVDIMGTGSDSDDCGQ